MEAPTIDVIVPVFNEAEILELFYKRISALGLPMNLIFVDNASSDDSVNIIRGFPGATLIQHDINEGYGGSLIDGITYSHNDNIIIFDAEFEYPPEAIRDLLDDIKPNQAMYHELTHHI